MDTATKYNYYMQPIRYKYGEHRQAFLAGQLVVYALLIRNRTRDIACLDTGLNRNDISNGGFAELKQLAKGYGCEVALSKHGEDRYLLHVYRKDAAEKMREMDRVIQSYRSGKLSRESYICRTGEIYGYPGESIKWFLKKK